MKTQGTDSGGPSHFQGGFKDDAVATTTSERKTCPGSDCKEMCGGWTKRNWIHVILLASAAAALVGAILGSLDSCSSEIQNVTVETEYVAPLASMVLLDDSGSMTCDASVSTSDSWCSYCCNTINSACCAGNPVNTNCFDDASCDSRMDQAKANLPGLYAALDAALNDGIDDDNVTDKFYGGLVLWGETNDMSVAQSLTDDMNAINVSIAAIDRPSSATEWTQSLCQCYNDLTAHPSLTSQGGNGLCILMADGANQQADPHTATACTATLSAIDGLYGNESLYTTHQDMETFVKSQNITILSVLVGYEDGWSAMSAASSCDDYPTCTDKTYCNDPTRNMCPYYLYLESFSELQSKLESIASTQRRVASSVVSETRESSVSVCSLDFLYALLAFIPFLAYLIYRVVVIKSKSKSIRQQLYAMIKNNMLSRDDMNHFATVATNLLLPANFKSDVDWIISYILFQCPCLLPASKSDLDAVFAANTIAL